MVLPTTMPTPMAGPMAARPYPTVAMLPEIAATTEVSTLGFSFRCGPDRASEPVRGLCSVLFSDGELDVDRREEREDVGLEDGDQDLEQRECESEDEGADAEQPEEAGALPLVQEEARRREEQHEEEVPDDHVERQTEGERDRPEDEGREELDRRHDEVEVPGHAGREERVPEELDRVLAEAGVDEREPGDDGEQHRQADHRGAGDV